MKRKTIELDLINKDLKISDGRSDDVLALKNLGINSEEEQKHVQVVEFSLRIVSCLKDKVKNHNLENADCKVSFSSLRRAFCDASANVVSGTRIQFSIASVNKLLRITSGRIDLTKSLDPIEEDYIQAQEDLFKYDLNFNFNSVDELYIDKETNKFWYDL